MVTTTRAVRTVGLPRLLTLLLPATGAMFALFNGVQQILLPAAAAARPSPSPRRQRPDGRGRRRAPQAKIYISALIA